MSNFYASLKADEDREIVALPIFEESPPRPEAREDEARVQEALTARVGLAQSLATLAESASKVLDFSPSDAQAATKDLVTQIENVDHHPLKVPGVSSVDPQAYLDKAVAYLVEVQALREYRKILPKIRDAVAVVDSFFEAERPAYLVIMARRVDTDEKLTETVIATNLSVDLTLLEPSLETFGLKLLPSAIGPVRNATPDHPLSESEKKAADLKRGLSVGLTETMHSLVSSRASASRTTSQSLHGLALDLDRATGGGLPPPAIGAGELTEVPDLAQLIASRIPEKEARLTTTSDGPYAKLRESVLRALAASLTKDEADVVRNSHSGDRLSKLLAAKVNDLIFGAALVALSPHLLEKKPEDQTDFPSVPPGLDAETAMLVAPGYIPIVYSNLPGSRFCLYVPPAGPAIATLNRALVVLALPECFKDASHAQ